MKNNKFILRLIVFIAFIYPSCTINREESDNVLNDFSLVKMLNSNILTNDSNLFLDPAQIFIKDSLLFIVDQGFDHFVLVYNHEKKEVVKRVLSAGRGDGELSGVLLFNDFGENSVRLYDAPLNTLYEYSWPGLSNGTYTSKKTINCNGSYPFRTIQINDSLIFYTGMDITGNCQYFIYNVNTSQEECIFEFPDYESIMHLSSPEKGMALQAGLIASPNRQYVLAYYSNFGLLDFFSIDEGNVKELSTKLYYEGDFTPISGETFNSTAVSDQTIMGFIAAYCTNNYVYVLYSDKTLEDLKNTIRSGAHLLCYDWEGNPVMLYELDSPIESFCIQDNIIYGIRTSTDTYRSEIVQFEL
jgi:hypothetical protein